MFCEKKRGPFDTAQGRQRILELQRIDVNGMERVDHGIHGRHGKRESNGWTRGQSVNIDILAFPQNNGSLLSGRRQ